METLNLINPLLTTGSIVLGVYFILTILERFLKKFLKELEDINSKLH